MKDIKSYVIGFLTCACLFLIMGQTKSDSQIGRYQVVSHSKGVNVGLFLVDTRNGETKKLREIKKEWKEYISGVKIP